MDGDSSDSGETRTRTVHRVTAPVIDIYGSPGIDSGRETQAVFGDSLEEIKRERNWAKARLLSNGNEGYVRLGQSLEHGTREPTHSVTSAVAFVYRRADYKSPEVCVLPMNSLVRVEWEELEYSYIPALGFVHTDRLQPLGSFACDLAAEAEKFLGAPYLWGGRTFLGIDCSGLVLAAGQACGLALIHSSTWMREQFGVPVGPCESIRRNDLVFWPGHVGIMQDSNRLLHATQHPGRRRVVSENLIDVMAYRNEAAGETITPVVKRITARIP